MVFNYPTYSGKRAAINIPDDAITGKGRDEFVKANAERWAGMHGVPVVAMEKHLGEMWDTMNPAPAIEPKPAKAAKQAEAAKENTMV